MVEIGQIDTSAALKVDEQRRHHLSATSTKRGQRNVDKVSGKNYQGFEYVVPLILPCFKGSSVCRTEMEENHIPNSLTDF